VSPWRAAQRRSLGGSFFSEAMHDTRLIGTWRSDAPRTLKELAARRDFAPDQRRGLSRLFGKLELRFTKTRCFSTLDGHTESAPYTVVAKDSSSVATVSPDLLTGTPGISHIHFEGSRFWIHVGTGALREFFKRLGPPNRALQPTSRARKKAKSNQRSRAARG
jgi:hypothetical protein